MILSVCPPSLIDFTCQLFRVASLACLSVFQHVPTFLLHIVLYFPMLHSHGVRFSHFLVGGRHGTRTARGGLVVTVSVRTFRRHEGREAHRLFLW